MKKKRDEKLRAKFGYVQVEILDDGEVVDTRQLLRGDTYLLPIPVEIIVCGRKLTKTVTMQVKA